MSKEKKVQFKVNGIHCNGCANKIKNSIGTISMDQTTEVDVPTGIVKVKFDAEKASVSDIKKKILDVGFQVESVELE